MVVFDAMGVLYEVGDDETELLIPYLRELGCKLPEADVRGLYRRASLGHLTSDEFWAACGVDGDDATYCSRHRLMPGMKALLEDLAALGTHVACLSNDVSEWSRILRQQFGLDSLIRTWVVSGDIGVRKPDAGAFLALSELAGVPLDQMVFFDDREANADAARAAGMNAVVFRSVAQARQLLFPNR